MLLENYTVAIPLLDEALSGSMTPNMVETWPLYIQFRKTEHFKEFKRKYAKELEHQTINPEELNEPRNSDQSDNLQDLKHSIPTAVEEPNKTTPKSPQEDIT